MAQPLGRRCVAGPAQGRGQARGRLAMEGIGGQHPPVPGLGRLQPAGGGVAAGDHHAQPRLPRPDPRRLPLIGPRHRRPGPLEVGASSALAPGRHEVAVFYEVGAGETPGRMVLLVDGSEADETAVPGTLPLALQHGGAGLRLGHDTGFPHSRLMRALLSKTGGLALGSAALAATVLRPRWLTGALRLTPMLRPVFMRYVLPRLLGQR